MQALRVLQLDKVGFRTHSCRRGGATALARSGGPVETIRQYGRWAAERSCREYIRLGVVALLRFQIQAPQVRSLVIVQLAGMVKDLFVAYQGRQNDGPGK